ncbi:type VI secretion system protein TssA [Algicola sagamiensis]|uniref:type VI secretion system protein TssA n=1 Tax=Algicola sagamiensis TaxID=163869 RepID=UPI00037F8C55|nr:type VI secretion system protein TssA [Algicola sagamiensis]
MNDFIRLPSQGESRQSYIEHYFNVPYDSLMAPIGADAVGESVRQNGVYFQIKQARQSDDPSLPVGVWSHELRTADWAEVRKLAIDALCHKCKDLQLGVWLFESNIHLHGLAGIAPATALLHSLCETYWETMHPQMVDGDMEYRTNPINWINDKLTPRLRLLPLTQTVLDGEEYCWDDWENAIRYEQLRDQKKHSGDWEGPTPKLFKQRVAATSTEFYQQCLAEIEDAGQAISGFQDWLDDTCGNEAPSFADLSRLLKAMHDLVSTELQKRGVSLAPKKDSDDDGQSGDDEQSKPPPGGQGGGSGPLTSREDAFVLLRQAAEYLMEDDPHSPVPYLVYTACKWGEKSAPELYQELFLNQGGQLNIFEIMGLDVERRS